MITPTPETMEAARKKAQSWLDHDKRWAGQRSDEIRILSLALTLIAHTSAVLADQKLVEMASKAGAMPPRAG